MVKEKEKQPSQICLIAPSDTLASRARSMISKSGLSIDVFVGALESAAEIAEQLAEKGTWLFISRRGTKNFLERRLGTTVIDIPVAASDYIPAIQQAREEKGLVAFFTVEEPSDELKTMCYLLHIQAKYYRFSDMKSCERAVSQAVADGVVLGIGGAVSGEYAKKMVLSYITVENSDESIQHALETACQMYQIHIQKEKDKELLQIELERHQNILNYTHDAIIAIDDRGDVRVMNRVARQMINMNGSPVEGRPIEEVLPDTRMHEVLRTGRVESNQLMNINGIMISTNRVPIIVNGKVKGVVATFRDIKSLQNAEQKIRIKLHEKGLTAKYRFADIIGSSEVMQDVKQLAEEFADSQFTVMLYGETGTGKEMFAQSIHNASPRKNGPFVAVNCTALSKSLLESELFGYADGSFTGAKRGGKPGLFEIAHGGTVFLDEIGELPMEFQAQFLRVIQEKEVRRVGGEKVIPVDIRVIGATNRNLVELVEEGMFRRDLFYRLNVLNLTIPGLRDRGNDFLEIGEVIYSKTIVGGRPGGLEEFRRLMKGYQTYEWPGNVRELHNIVERVCLLQKQGVGNGRMVRVLGGMLELERAGGNAKEEMGNNSIGAGRPLEEIALGEIKEAIRRNGGNVSQAAKELGIGRSTLYRKLGKI